MTNTHKSTLGQKAADFAAAKIGSWGFLISFNAAMACWIAFNTYLGDKAFDPAPFIGLNLMLSWMAGVQAPLIMISQNRQEEVQRQTVESIADIGRATFEIAAATKDLLEEHSDMLEDLVENDEQQIADICLKCKQEIKEKQCQVSA